MENYGELREKISPWRVPTLPNYAGGCSLVRLETARTFFSNPDHQVEGTAGYLVKVTDQVRDCARLRQRDGAAVAEFLSTFTDQV